MDHQFKEDRKTVLILKISSISQRKSISGTYLIITSLPEDEKTSKHGGGGRYDAILEFKGSKLKKFNEKEKGKYIYMRKRKKYMSMCKNKVNSPVL
jgi:hypothetical protein